MTKNSNGNSQWKFSKTRLSQKTMSNAQIKAFEKKRKPAKNDSTDIIDKIAMDTGLSLNKSEDALFSMYDAIVKHLKKKKSNKVKLHGFGEFYWKRDERLKKQGVNSLVFKPGSRLKNFPVQE